MQEYEECYQSLINQTEEYNGHLAQFEEEISSLENVLHATVNQVVDELKGTYDELVNNKVRNIDFVNKQLQGLRDTLQTSHALRGLMEEFHNHANPIQLIEDNEGDEDDELIIHREGDEMMPKIGLGDEDGVPVMDYHSISPSHQQRVVM